MARMKSWRGKEVGMAVAVNVARAMGEFGLRVEAHAKRELKKGHGVITGTLRRSLHTCQPGYNWASDDVQPSANSPERGGQAANAMISGRKITIQVGSGLNYAMPVHQGHHGFGGYHFMTNGLEKAKPEMQSVLKKYKLK